MVTFDQLMREQFHGIESLAQGFESLVRTWEFSSELTGDVITPLHGSGWRGDAAERAAGTLAKVRNEIDAAFEEASGLAKTLRDAYTELAASRADLDAAVRKAADHAMTVDSSGAVRWSAVASVADRHDPNYESGCRQKAQEVAGDIAKALARAAAADAAAAAALGAVTGKDENSFLAAPGSRVEEQARQAADMLKLAGGMTDAQLAQLNTALKDHAGDPRFTTAFYQSLGPDGLITFYGRLAAASGTSGGSRPQAITDLQANLGTALATATDTRNYPRLSDEWEAGLRRAGSARTEVWPPRQAGRQRAAVRLPDPGEHPAHRDVRPALPQPGRRARHPAEPGQGLLDLGPVERDRVRPAEAPRGAAGWVQPDGGGAGGARAQPVGRDAVLPRPGDGLHHGRVGQDLQPAQHLSEGADLGGLGLPAPGRLAGAQPADGPRGALKRRGARARPGGGHHRTLLRRAAGPVATAHAGHGGGDEGRDRPLRQRRRPEAPAQGRPVRGPRAEPRSRERRLHGRRAVGAEPAGPHAAQQRGPAHLGQESTAKFLGALGRNPEAFGVLAQAQQAYTTAHIQDVMLRRDVFGDQFGQAVNNAAHPGGEVAGILTAARTSALVEELKGQAEAYNKSIDQNAMWGKAVWAFTGGKVLGEVPVVGSGMSQPVNYFIDQLAANYHIEANTADAATAADVAGLRGSAAAAKRAVEQAAQGTGLNSDQIEALSTGVAHQVSAGVADSSGLFTRAVNG